LNDTTLVERSTGTTGMAPLQTMAKRMLLARLGALHRGRLHLRDGNERLVFGGGQPGAEASLMVLDPACYSEIAFGGSIGAGESYMLGHWTSDNLTALMRLMLQNRSALDALDTGVARLAVPLRQFAHWLHRNTRAGSRRNIALHYDLGNDLFRLFLDETMMYSCAYFERPDMTLAQASTAKLDRVCRKLALGPGDHVLEIGTGWGGFALHAAGRYGCRVTTTTISPSQRALAQERVERVGLADRITILLEDYRDLRGSYDKLVSIEMIEAIGHQFLGDYFRCCAERLQPGGRMLLQAITIADRHYARTRDEVDFIKRHVFPGAFIPAISAMAQAMAVSSDLRIVHLEDIGPHYATTLARWRDNFTANLDQVRALGYPETFIRMWEFYFCYCEAGFAERQLGDVQMVLTREG
jgi:cyclopropane-fatty-acyl-phospholipid synthase